MRRAGPAQLDKRIIGGIFVTLSALFFTLSTVFAKYVNLASDLPPIMVTLVRFMVGSVLIGGYVLVGRVRIKPVRLDLVIWRAVLNSVSLILFYYGVQLSTVSKANLLNMTFPIFVFLSSPFITRDRPKGLQYAFLATTMLGMYLVVLPDFSHVNTGDLMSLLSAVAAGASVSVLKESRKTDGAVVVLFFLMTVGLAVNLPLAIPVWRMPEPELWRDLALSGLCGLFGQVCTTIGAGYFSASTSSLVSSSRILFALVIGVWLFADPLPLRILFGGALILGSLVGVSGLLPWPRHGKK